MKQIAWIGTGVMGGQQAGHLAKNGYPVKAYNRSQDKLEALKEEFGLCHGGLSQGCGRSVPGQRGHL